MKNEVGSGYYKAVVIWRGSVPVSADDLNFVLEASDRVDDVIITHGTSKPSTIMTVLIKASELAPSAQSDPEVYTRPNKRSRPSE